MCESKQGVPDLTALCSYQTIESSRCLRKVCPNSGLVTDRRQLNGKEKNSSFFGRSDDHIAAAVPDLCVAWWIGGYQGAARSARESPKKSPKKAPVS